MCPVWSSSVNVLLSDWAENVFRSCHLALLHGTTWWPFFKAKFHTLRSIHIQSLKFISQSVVELLSWNRFQKLPPGTISTHCRDTVQKSFGTSHDDRSKTREHTNMCKCSPHSTHGQWILCVLLLNRKLFQVGAAGWSCPMVFFNAKHPLTRTNSHTKLEVNLSKHSWVIPQKPF